VPALSVAALAAIIHACTPQAAGKPLVPVELVASIAEHESGLDPWALHDNADGNQYRPATFGDAVAVAKRLIAEGHSVDIGVMQVNSANLSRTGLTVETAFDPCQSVRAGSTILSEGMSRYNTGSPSAGISTYVPKVGEAAKQIIPQLDAADTTDIHSPAPDDPCAGMEDWCVSSTDN
jgi:type IV secretion system protein VirB1